MNRVCPKHGPHDGADCPVEWRYRPWISYSWEITQDCPKGLSWDALRPPWFLARWWRRFLWSASTV